MQQHLVVHLSVIRGAFLPAILREHVESIRAVPIKLMLLPAHVPKLGLALTFAALRWEAVITVSILITVIHVLVKMQKIHTALLLTRPLIMSW